MRNLAKGAVFYLFYLITLSSAGDEVHALYLYLKFYMYFCISRRLYKDHFILWLRGGARAASNEIDLNQFNSSLLASQSRPPEQPCFTLTWVQQNVLIN